MVQLNMDSGESSETSLKIMMRMRRMLMTLMMEKTLWQIMIESLSGEAGAPWMPWLPQPPLSTGDTGLIYRVLIA